MLAHTHTQTQKHENSQTRTCCDEGVQLPYAFRGLELEIKDDALAVDDEFDLFLVAFEALLSYQCLLYPSDVDLPRFSETQRPPITTGIELAQTQPKDQGTFTTQQPQA